jgi:hypothetical protein
MVQVCLVLSSGEEFCLANTRKEQRGSPQSRYRKRESREGGGKRRRAYAVGADGEVNARERDHNLPTYQGMVGLRVCPYQSSSDVSWSAPGWIPCPSTPPHLWQSAPSHGHNQENFFGGRYEGKERQTGLVCVCVCVCVFFWSPSLGGPLRLFLGSPPQPPRPTPHAPRPTA